MAPKTKTITRWRNKPKTHRKRAAFTLPLAIVAGLAPGAMNAFGYISSGDARGAGIMIARDWTGYDAVSKKWVPSLMWGGTYPLVIGILIHRAASILGVNRALGQARIPFLRI